MIVHKSVVKRSRQALKHRERNVAVKSGIRTGIKTVLGAVENKDPEAAKGAFHKKTASRKTSRLTKHVNSLKA